MHMSLHCGSLGFLKAVLQLLEHRDTKKLPGPATIYPGEKGSLWGFGEAWKWVNT